MNTRIIFGKGWKKPVSNQGLAVNGMELSAIRLSNRCWKRDRVGNTVGVKDIIRPKLMGKH